MTDDNPKAFKHFLGPDAVVAIADVMARVHPPFSRERFVAVADRLDPLELKQRVEAITEALHEALALPFAKAVKVVTQACPAPGASKGHFVTWPLVRYIGRYGVDHPEAALAALHTMTATFSGEFDVRPFLVRHPDIAWPTLAAWARDPNEHVRRLVSEGSRPRLPWGERLAASIADPGQGLALLEVLRDDPSEYVRRSVANHLNDVAKDHPDRAVEVAARWLAEAPTETMRQTVTHALRALVKRGHAGALAVLGHGDAKGLGVVDLVAPDTVAIGDALAFSFRVVNKSAKARSVVVDFALHYIGKRGATKAPKVFKLKTLELPARGSVALAKRHPMRHVSIRRLEPGRHRLDIQVNGAVVAGHDFDLVDA